MHQVSVPSVELLVATSKSQKVFCAQTNIRFGLALVWAPDSLFHCKRLHHSIFCRGKTLAASPNCKVFAFVESGGKQQTDIYNIKYILTYSSHASPKCCADPLPTTLLADRNHKKRQTDDDHVHHILTCLSHTCSSRPRKCPCHAASGSLPITNVCL